MPCFFVVVIIAIAVICAIAVDTVILPYRVLSYNAKELANGYYLLLAAIVIAGLCGCLSAMSGKVIDTIRKIAQPLLVALVVSALVIGAVMVKTVNEYMSANDISNFKMAMDCGIILALVFAIALCVCEYLPAIIEKGKNKAKPMQAQF